MDIAKRYTVYFLSLLLIYSPILHSAAELSDAERRQISTQVQGLEGSIRGGANEINIEQAKQIFDNNIQNSQRDNQHIDELKNFSGDPAALSNVTRKYKSDLNTDSEKDSKSANAEDRPSDLGTAYKMVKEDQKVANDRLKSMKTSDGAALNIENSIFDTTKTALDKIEDFANEFGGCTESVTINTSERPVPSPEYYYCERNFLKEEKYTIFHKILLEERSEEKRKKRQQNQNRSAIASRSAISTRAASSYVPLIPDYAVVESADNKMKLGTTDGISTLSFSANAKMASFNSPMVLVYKRKIKVPHPKEIDAAYISKLELPTMGKVLMNGKVIADRTHPNLRKEVFMRSTLTQVNPSIRNPKHAQMDAMVSTEAILIPNNYVFALPRDLPDELYLTYNKAPSTYTPVFVPGSIIFGGGHYGKPNMNAAARVLGLFNTINNLQDGVYIDIGRKFTRPPKPDGYGRYSNQAGALRNVNEFINNPYKENGHIDITDAFRNLKQGQEVDIEVWSLFINFPDPIMHEDFGNGFIFQYRTFYRIARWAPASNYQREAGTNLTMVFDLGAKKQEEYIGQEGLDIVAKGADADTKITTTCKVMRSGIDPEDLTSCATIQGRKMCPEDLIDSPKGLEHISKMCAEYEVRVEKKICDTNLEGKEECIFRSEVPDTCEAYRVNPICRKVGHSCAKLNSTADASAEYSESTAQCAADETTLEKWDCGTPLKLTEHEISNNYDCPGKIKCMGTDCIGDDPEKDFPTNFGKVTALIKAAEMASQDSDCFDPDSNIPTDQRLANCRIFAGKVKTCGDPTYDTAIGSVRANNCCNPKGAKANPKDYLGAMLKLAKLHTGIMRLQDGNMLKGAYQTLQQPISNAVSYVTKPFTSAIENMTASTKEFFKPMTDYVSKTLEQLKKKAAEAIKKLFARQSTATTGQAATTTATTTATQQAAKQAGQKAADTIATKILEGAVQGFNAIMLAYTIYQVGELANQLLNKCEGVTENHGADYMNLAVNRKLKNCGSEPFKVERKRSGSKNVLKANKINVQYYCCYNSPLARIFSEQAEKALSAEAKAQRDRDIAAARRAGKWVSDPGTCGGIRLADLEKIDIGKLDLSEWTAMLQQYGFADDPAQMTVDKLTGKDSDMADALGDAFGDEERPNVVDRTVERLTPKQPDEYHYDKLLNKMRNDIEKSITYD